MDLVKDKWQQKYTNISQILLLWDSSISQEFNVFSSSETQIKNRKESIGNSVKKKVNISSETWILYDGFQLSYNKTTTKIKSQEICNECVWSLAITRVKSYCFISDHPFPKKKKRKTCKTNETGILQIHIKQRVQLIIDKTVIHCFLVDM